MASKIIRKDIVLAELVIHPEVRVQTTAGSKRVIEWLLRTAAAVEKEHRKMADRFTARLLEPAPKAAGRLGRPKKGAKR